MPIVNECPIGPLWLDPESGLIFQDGKQVDMAMLAKNVPAAGLTAPQVTSLQAQVSGYWNWTSAFYGFGDSITADGGRIIDTSGVVATNINQYSWHKYAELYCGGRFFWAGSFGQASYTIAQLKDEWLPRLIAWAGKGSRVLVLMGQNNAGGTAQERADYTYCLEAMLAAGLVPVVCLLTPGTAARTRHILNAHYLREAARLRLLVADVGGAVTDASTGGWTSSMDRDGVHPSAAGARLMGIAAGTALQASSDVPWADPWLPDHSAAWGPNRTTENGGTTNPTFATSSGGSPDVPTGWSVLSGSHAGAFVYATGGGIVGRSCQFVAPTSGELIVRNSTCNTALPGDQLLLVGRMTTVAAGSYIRMGLQDLGSTTIWDGGRFGSQGSYDNVARSQFAIPIRHTGAATGLRLDVIVAGNGASATFEQFGIVNLTALGLA